MKVWEMWAQKATEAADAASAWQLKYATAVAAAERDRAELAVAMPLAVEALRDRFVMGYLAGLLDAEEER